MPREITSIVLQPHTILFTTFKASLNHQRRKTIRSLSIAAFCSLLETENGVYMNYILKLIKSFILENTHPDVFSSKKKLYEV